MSDTCLIEQHSITIHRLRGRLVLRKADCQGDTWEEDDLLARLDNLEAHVTGKPVEQVQQEVIAIVAGLALKPTVETEEEEMQLDRIEFSETGIILYGKDGTSIHFSVQDAMELSRWLGQNYVALFRLHSKQYKQERQQKREQK